MMMRLSHNRRWLLYPCLLIWWLWSSTALCNAQSVALPDGEDHHSAVALQDYDGALQDHAMPMHDHAASTTSDAKHDHSGADASHDCCAAAELQACCGPVDVLQTKSSLDIEPYFFAVLLSWLAVVVEPVGATFPTIDTVASHVVFPRLHLLLSVFLD